MDGFARSVGDGVSGLVAGAFGAIGTTLRGMVEVEGWNLVKR